MSNKFWHGLSETLLWWRPAKEGEEKSRYMAIYTRLLRYARTLPCVRIKTEQSDLSTG